MFVRCAKWMTLVNPSHQGFATTTLHRLLTKPPNPPRNFTIVGTESSWQVSPAIHQPLPAQYPPPMSPTTRSGGKKDIVGVLRRGACRHFWDRNFRAGVVDGHQDFVHLRCGTLSSTKDRMKRLPYKRLQTFIWEGNFVAIPLGSTFDVFSAELR